MMMLARGVSGAARETVNATRHTARLFPYTGTGGGTTGARAHWYRRRDDEPTHVSAVIKSASSSSPSVQYLNGLWLKSTRAIVSVMILVPNRSLRRVSEV
jgi:hypothetical protein